MAALGLTMSAYAQQQAGWMSANNAEVATAWGWDGAAFDKNKTSHPAGTLIAETQSIVLRTAFTDDCCGSSISSSGVTYFVVNGEQYAKFSNEDNAFQGAVGNTNPPAIVLSNIVMEKGWVLDYECKKDGYLTVFGKISLNKNTYVVEGVMNSEGAVSPNGAVAYDFYGVNDKSNAEMADMDFTYKLPKDEDGYINMDAPDIKKYTGDADIVMWPYRIFLGTGDNEATAGSYPGVFTALVFPVYADCHYYVFCTGSKVTAGPYVYTDEYPTQITAIHDGGEEGEDIIYNLVGEYKGSGVESVIAPTLDENAPIYNTQGVRVGADAKGILIQNGKKFVRF